ncbi:MAG: DUF4349 domain-containing protein [Bryobacteraceae bacterium]
MTTHPIAGDELMAYLDGELTVERAAGVAAHLEHCRECQGLAADLQRVSRRLLEWQIEESSSVLQHWLAEALQAVEEPKTDTRRKGSYLLVRPWTWAASTAAVLILVGVMVWQTGSRESERLVIPHELAQSDGAEPARLAQSMRAMLMESATSGAVGGVIGNVPQAAPAPPPEEAVQTGRPLIVRTAEMSITTREFDRTRPEVTRIVDAHDGYIAQLSMNSPSDHGRSLSATLRVPAGQLDRVFSELRKLGRIQSESQAGEEVTQQYIDLSARLKNARNTEERLTEILRQRTGKLSDVLAVEEQIDRTRGEIERMNAELKNLSNRITLATIQLQVSEECRQALRVDHSSTLGRIRNAAVEGFRGVIEGAIAILIFLLAYGPGLLILAVLVLFPGRALWKVVQQRTRPEQQS